MFELYMVIWKKVNNEKNEIGRKIVEKYVILN